MEMDIFYRNEHIGKRRVDFFVEGVIMVELKALIQLEDVHLAQAMNYCQAYNLPIGLLINFGSKSLQHKRVYNLNHPDNKENQQKMEPQNNVISRWIGKCLIYWNLLILKSHKS